MRTFVSLFNSFPIPKILDSSATSLRSQLKLWRRRTPQSISITMAYDKSKSLIFSKSGYPRDLQIELEIEFFLSRHVSQCWSERSFIRIHDRSVLLSHLWCVALFQWASYSHQQELSGTPREISTSITMISSTMYEYFDWVSSSHRLIVPWCSFHDAKCR